MHEKTNGSSYKADATRPYPLAPSTPQQVPASWWLQAHTNFCTRRLPPLKAVLYTISTSPMIVALEPRILIAPAIAVGLINVVRSWSPWEYRLDMDGGDHGEV